ncbi:MAG: hypothetical protein ACXW1U_20110 [Methylobacter sp.]
MSQFTIHSIQTAPAEAKPLLEDSLQNTALYRTCWAAWRSHPRLCRLISTLAAYSTKRR